MNCEEYREAIAGDPSESFPDGREHAAACDACRGFRDEMRALDARIAQALALRVPELRMPELPADVPPAAGKVVDFPRGSARVPAPAWLGIAAAVAIAAFVGFRVLVPQAPPPTLAEQVIEHMDHEQESRVVTSVAVPEQALGRVLEPDVSSMDEDLGLVTYAQSCVINGHTVPHLVIQGKSGPVTLILLPDEDVGAAVPLSGEHVHGVIVPVGSGSVAIIGERSEQLGEIEEIGDRVAGSVKWRI